MNLVSRAFRVGADLFDKFRWIQGAELRQADVDGEAWRDGDPINTPDDRIYGMCAIGSMRRALYYDLLNEFRNSNNGDEPNQANKDYILSQVEDVMQEAQKAFMTYFLSDRAHCERFHIDVLEDPEGWIEEENSGNLKHMHQLEFGCIEEYNDQYCDNKQTLQQLMRAVADAQPDA